MATGAPGGTGGARPALDNLKQGQIDLVDELREGFESLDRQTEWVLEVMIWSGGRIEEEFLHSLAGGGRDKVGLEYLGPAIYEKPVDREVARNYRLNVAASYLVPAFNDVTEELRWEFTEYGENPPDAGSQSHAAMRPAWEGLGARQWELLSELLEGFEGREGVLDWCQDLSAATLGEMENTFPRDVTGRDRTAVKNLVTPSEYARENPVGAWRYRHRMAAHIVLPWFNTALKEQASRASEQPVDVDEDVPEFELGEEDLFGEDAGDGGF